MPKKEDHLANVLAGERTDLAIDRTVMAASRTLMAWVRTALSLISFGFTIYKFLEATTAVEKTGLLGPMHPRRFGLTLLALGTLSVIMGSVEYFQTISKLNQQSKEKYNPLNFSFILGLIIGLLGLFLFITILIHQEVL